MKLARILLADDDLHVLATINKLLRTDFEIVDMVTDGPSLVAAALEFRPDVIVTDISMPKMNGIEAIRQIRGFLPGVKCIFLTMHGTSGYRREAQNVGAIGYVLKSLSPGGVEPGDSPCHWKFCIARLGRKRHSHSQPGQALPSIAESCERGLRSHIWCVRQPHLFIEVDDAGVHC